MNTEGSPFRMEKWYVYQTIEVIMERKSTGSRVTLTYEVPNHVIATDQAKQEMGNQWNVVSYRLYCDHWQKVNKYYPD